MTLDMYAENVLDHYRNPKNYGKLSKPDVRESDLNPLCGDHYEFQIRLSRGAIKDVKFNGDGCAISMASASMLSEFVKGKKLSSLSKLSEKDVVRLLKIEVSPVRMKCAMLPIDILRRCARKI